MGLPNSLCTQKSTWPPTTDHLARNRSEGMTHAVLHPLAGDLLQTSLARSLSLAPYHQGINILTPHNGLCPSTPLIAVLTFPPLAISHLTAFTLLFSLLEDPASNHHHRAFKTLSQTTQSGHPLVIPETLLKFISQWLTAGSHY